MAISPQELVSDVSDLVSLPEVCVRINEMIENPNSTADSIGKFISQDPALTAKLLRVANSPFYGFSSEIGTVSKAVAVLGTKQIRDLVLATSVSDVFKNMSNELITIQNFWEHSIYCGLIARIIAYENKKAQGESVFIAGLLHDIGQLIIFSKLPEQAKEALLLSVEGPEDGSLSDAEQQVLGFDHAQVGGELIRHWKLPVALQECVEFHHDPTKAKEAPIEVAIIHLANILATMGETETSETIDESDLDKVDPVAWQLSGLAKDEIEAVLGGARAQISEVQSLFSLG